MADEITVGMHLRVDDGTIYLSFAKSGISLDLTGSQYIQNMQAVGDAEEALIVGDIATGGWFAAYNSHATATISVRAGTGIQDTVDIGPGEPCLFRTHVGSTIYVISSVAGAELEYVLVEA